MPVGFSESPAEDSGANEDDLSDNAVRLASRQHQVNSFTRMRMFKRSPCIDFPPPSNTKPFTVKRYESLKAIRDEVEQRRMEVSIF